MGCQGSRMCVGWRLIKLAAVSLIHRKLLVYVVQHARVRFLVVMIHLSHSVCELLLIVLFWFTQFVFVVVIIYIR